MTKQKRAAKVHSLADELERLEFVERVPELQLPWDRARHPALNEYRVALLTAEPRRFRLDKDHHKARKQIIEARDAMNAAKHCFQERLELREQGGLRRVCDAEARRDTAVRQYNELLAQYRNRKQQKLFARIERAKHAPSRIRW